MSDWGGETVAILNVLETVSMPLARDHPDVQEKIGIFINHGVMYRDFWAAVIHGDMQAPPRDQGLAFREEFFQWRDNAGGLARSHRRAVQEAEAKDRAAEGATPLEAIGDRSASIFTKDGRQFVAVDVEGANEEMNEWAAAHPDATEAAAIDALNNPKYWMGGETDGETEYTVFPLDPSTGRIGG
jgi:hypothetical protein